MTITNTDSRYVQATGNGVTTQFNISWPVIQNSDATYAIKVIKTTISSGATSTLTQGVDYTVTLNSTSPSAGYITISPALSSLYRITILDNIPIKQELDLQNAVQVDMPSIEAALDKQLITLQNVVNEKLQRAVLLAEDTTVRNVTLPAISSDVANELVVINAAGDGMTTAAIDELVGITSFDISALTADASPDGAADYVPTYDTSAAAQKKVLLNNLPVNVSGKTTIDTVDTTNDMLLVYDASAGTNKKVAPINLGLGSTNLGDVKDVQVTDVTAASSISATTARTFYDVTGMSVSTTPGAVTDWVVIGGMVNIGAGANGNSVAIRVIRSDGKIIGKIQELALTHCNTISGSNGVATSHIVTLPFFAIDEEVGSTSALTYKLQLADFAGSSVTYYLNRSSSDTDASNFGRTASQINLTRFTKTDNTTSCYTNFGIVKSAREYLTLSTTEVNGADETGAFHKINPLIMTPQNSSAKMIIAASVSNGTDEKYFLRLLNAGSLALTPASSGSRYTATTALISNPGATLTSYSPTKLLFTSISPAGTQAVLELGLKSTSTFNSASTFHLGRGIPAATKYNNPIAPSFLSALSLNTATSGTPYKQVVVATNLAASSTSTATNTFTTAGTAVTLTPTSASSKLLMVGNINVGYDSASGNDCFYFKIQRDGSDIIVGDAASSRSRCLMRVYCPSGNGYFTNIPVWLYVAAGSTSSTTITPGIILQESGSKTLNINRTTGDTDATSYFRTYSDFTVVEILPN